MKRIVNLGRSPLLLALLATQACQAFPIPQATPTPSATTPMPSATVAIATAPPTKTPMLTPTRRVVSEELQTGLFQTHELVVLILFNAETTAEAAEHAIAGDVAPSDLPQLLLVLSGLADSVEWLIPFVTPPDRLQLQWEAALAVHAHTRDRLQRWTNDSTEAAQILQEMQGDLSLIRQTVDELEAILAGEYDIDMQSLTDAREEALAGIRAVFESTATPP